MNIVHWLSLPGKFTQFNEPNPKKYIWKHISFEAMKKVYEKEIEKK